MNISHNRPCKKALFSWLDSIVSLTHSGGTLLTRSLPRDVYIRRQNDHPGGQGRIYTSHLNFVSFVKARPPAWLLFHVSEVSSSSVRWSLLALLGLFQWENSSSMLHAVLVQMAGNSVVAVPRCDKLVRAVRLMAFVTTAIEERARLVSSCWKRGLRMTVDICWERKLVTGAPGGAGGNDHTSAVNEDLDVSTHSERSPGRSLRRGIVGTNVRASLRVKHCESAVRRNPKQERCVRTLVK